MLSKINGFKSEEGFYVGIGAYPVGGALRHRRRGAVGVIRPVGAAVDRARRRTTLQRGGHHGLLAATTGLSLLGAVLILFGLVGLNLRHAEAAGVLGKVGFPIAFLGTALVIGISWAIFFVAPSAALEAPEFLDAQEVRGPLDTGFILSGFVFAVGWALFGAGAWLVRTYPRWVVVVFIVAALIQLFPFPGTGLLFGVAVALLGFFALTRGRTSYGRPSRMR